VSQVAASPSVVRFPALRVPEFRLYWATSTVAMFADNVEHVIGYWLLWELTHSPFWLGYAVFAHWFPFLLFSLHAGAWADRFNNRHLLQITQACYVVSSGGLGLLAVTGQLQLWHMIVLLLVHGFSGVIQMPSSQVLVHDLVGKDYLPNALSLSAGSRYLAQFVGPVIGGLLLATLGPGGGLLANVLFYAPLTVALVVLRPRVVSASQPQATGWRGISEGLRFVLRDRTLLALTLLSAIPGALIGFGYQALMPALAEELGAGQAGYSWLLSANGMGAIFGAAVLGYAGLLGHKGALVCAATLGWALLLALFAVVPWIWLAFVVLFLVGVTSIVSNALSQTLVQKLAPDHMRGRVLGVYSTAFFGPRVLSGVLLGALASSLGAHAAIGLLAVVIVLAVGVLMVRVPSLRELD
jgi:MFS family permease